MMLIDVFLFLGFDFILPYHRDEGSAIFDAIGVEETKAKGSKCCVFRVKFHASPDVEGWWGQK